MAVQQQLGILSVERTGLSADHPSGVGANGENLVFSLARRVQPESPAQSEPPPTVGILQTAKQQSRAAQARFADQRSLVEGSERGRLPRSNCSTMLTYDRRDGVGTDALLSESSMKHHPMGCFSSVHPKILLMGGDYSQWLATPTRANKWRGKRQKSIKPRVSARKTAEADSHAILRDADARHE
jgi:hypothetical protein